MEFFLDANIQGPHRQVHRGAEQSLSRRGWRPRQQPRQGGIPRVNSFFFNRLIDNFSVATHSAAVVGEDANNGRETSGVLPRLQFLWQFQSVSWPGKPPFHTLMIWAWSDVWPVFYCPILAIRCPQHLKKDGCCQLE